MKLRFRFYVAISLAGVAGVGASAATIGIDARNGGANANLALGSDFGFFRGAVTSSGNTIVNLFSFNTTDLASLDALILTQAMDPGPSEYSIAEISAVHNFVANGHGLLVVGEGGLSSDATVPNLNSLVMRYGVTYAGVPLGGSGDFVGSFATHALTIGLGTVGVDFYRPLSLIASPAVDLTLAGPDFLAAVNGVGGSGNVVLIGDSSMWADPNFLGVGSDTPINFGSNRLLLQNTLSFITVPEPSSCTLLVMGALAFFRLRKFGKTR